MPGPVHRPAACVLAALSVLLGLAACGRPPATLTKGTTSTLSTSTTTATVPPTQPAVTTTTTPGVAVPNVIGQKIASARAELHTVDFPTVSLNAPCNKGTLASQSVASSLSVAGKAPDFAVGATPLAPGTLLPEGTRIGILWSGCFGSGGVVPLVIGLTLAAAKHVLHGAGLTWACYSVGPSPTTTTTTTTAPSTTAPSTTAPSTTAPSTTAPSTTAPSTTAPSTMAPSTTTTRPPQLVLSQDPPAHTVLAPGTPVALTMHRCPQ